MNHYERRLENLKSSPDYVRKHKEKKGQHDYLAWGLQLVEAQRRYDQVEVEYLPCEVVDGVVGLTVRVRVSVRSGDEWERIELPLAVRDQRNQAIARPNAGDVEKARQRALAKAISMLTGIGMSIYESEIADMEPVEVRRNQDREALLELFHAIDETAEGGKKADRYGFISQTLGRRVTKQTVADLTDEEVGVILAAVDELTVARAKAARDEEAA